MSSKIAGFRRNAPRVKRWGAVVAITMVAGCASGGNVEYEYPTTVGTGGLPTYEQKRQSVLGPGGLTLFDEEQREKKDQGGGIAVNSYLWRASLDTISFMPLASADPFGGVIITDWYTPPEAPDERFKINIFILDRALRSDGVRASIFKQVRTGDGWRDLTADKQRDRQLEDAILTRARQLRIAGAGR